METNKQKLHKLVRDKIPQLMEKSGLKPHYRVLVKEDRWRALRNKLNEEVDELLAASDPMQVLEEAADVLEVLMSIVYESGHIDEDLYLKAKQKRREKGAFDRFICLESSD